MNKPSLSSPLTLYTGTHTDNLLSSLDVLVQDFSMEHGEHNVISLDTPTWEDIMAEARAVPFFSDLKLIIARYSIALKWSKKDTSDDEDSSNDDEVSVSRTKASSAKYDLSQIPDHARVVMVWNSQTIESSLFKWIEKNACIERFDELSSAELTAKAKILLPNISSVVLQYLTQLPPQEMEQAINFYHLGYHDDARWLSVEEISQTYKPSLDLKVYEMLDAILWWNPQEIAKLWYGLCGMGMMWSVLPSLRTQLRKYIAALDLLAHGARRDADGGVFGVKRYPLDKLMQRKHNTRTLSQLMMSINDIQRQMITGWSVGSMEDYVYLRIVTSCQDNLSQ